MIVMTHIIVSVTTNDTNNIVERKDISIRRVQLTSTKNPETWPTPRGTAPSTRTASSTLTDQKVVQARTPGQQKNRRSAEQ